MDLFENHTQEGGSELSEDTPSEAETPAPAPEPASDTAEAQPSLEDALPTTGQASVGPSSAPAGDGS